MKILKIFLFIILISIILILAASYLFIKNFDISRYKAQIIDKATAAVQRPVDFDQIDLEVSLKEGIRLKMTDLTVADEADFQNEEFLSVKELFVEVDVSAYMRNKQIKILSLDIVNPQATLIRNQQGVFNFESLGASQDSSGGPSPSSKQENGQQPVDLKDLPAIVVNSVTINNASISYVDHTMSPTLEAQVNQLSLDLKDFSLDKIFDVTLEAAMLSDQKNVSVNARVKLDIEQQTISVEKSKVQIDLTHTDLAALESSLVNMPGMNLPKELKGRLEVETGLVNIGASGLNDLNADIQLKDGSIDIPNIAPGISLRASAIDLGIENFTLTDPFQVDLKVAYLHPQQNVFVNGMVDLDSVKKSVELTNFNVKSELATLDFKELRDAVVAVKDIPLPEQAKGDLAVMIKSMTAGQVGVETMLADVSFSKGLLDFKEVAPGVALRSSQIDLNVKGFSLTERFTFDLKTAYLSDNRNININGEVALDLEKGRIHLTGTKADIDLGTLSMAQLSSTVTMLKDVPLPERMDGRLAMVVQDLQVGSKGLESILLDADVSGGMVDFKEISPGVALQLDQIELKLDGFNVNEWFGFDVKAAYLGTTPNIVTKGKATFNMNDQSIKISATQFETDFTSISLDQLKGSVAGLKDVSFPQKVNGVLKGNIEQAHIGSKGLKSLSMQGEFLDGLIKLKELELPMQEIQSTFAATESKFDLSNLSLVMGEGTVNATAVVDEYLTRQEYTMDIDINKIDISTTIDQSELPVNVEGFASGRFNLEGKGFDPKTMLNDMSGEGYMEIVDGMLKDLNLLRIVIDKISIIPNLARKLDESLAPEFKEKLVREDTVLDQVKVNAKIENGSVLIQPLDFGADDFLMYGQGKIGVDQNINFNGTFSIKPKLSANMVEAQEELENLMNTEGRIYMPLTIDGPISKPRVRVDIKDIGKNVIRKQAEKELLKALDKVFDKEPEPDTSTELAPPSTGEAQNSTQPGSGTAVPPASEVPEVTPEEQLIGDVLDILFK